MPTGQPDSHSTGPDQAPSISDRLIRAAMEAGEFNDLPGTGKPFPGAGAVDDEMWWVRSWLERNRDPRDQESSNSE